jgi:glucan phosphoethanolaminetransferase (alkaline phosphatase superfamily)
MGRLLTFFLVFNCFWVVASFAQSNNSGYATFNVRATATVTDNLNMLTIRNIDLLNPPVMEGLIVVSPITSPYAGMFKIIGSPGSRVRITYLQMESIREANEGIGVVSAEYMLSAAFNDLQFQSALLDVGEGVFPIGPDGELYVWLGANLDLSKATPGVYLSEFIIELEYI